MAESSRPETRKQGVAVSAGIAIGRAYLIGRDTLKAPRHHIDGDDIDTEVARLKKALSAADKQLEKVKTKLASENESDYHIISAHQLMIHDEHLADAAVQYISKDLVCAEWALRKAVDDIAVVFDSIEDDYLRTRMSDVEFVFERVLRNLLGRDTGPLAPPPDAVVVAYDLSPADTSTLHKAAVAGLLTDAGGRTSHTAIIARAHEIPAVVGLENITEVVETDDLLIVDGAAGVVIVNPTATTVAQYREEQWRQVAAGAQLLSNRDLPAQTKCGQARVQLYANIDSPEELDDAVEYGAEGIGLVRTEYLYMTSEVLPDEETHLRNATSMLTQMAGRPATLRTFDLGADKLARFLEEAKLGEANPALGLRSIRLCLTELGKPLFRTQLRGLLRASVHGPLRIMFPMISGIAELRAAKAALEEVRSELRQEGVPFDEHIKVGIMIEMPSAAITADLLAKEADFFSIGTNDLIQYTMAVDRVNEFVSYLYEPLHPALLRLIGGVARAAKTGGISVTVCGEMAGDPMIAPVLLGLGIYEFSMSAVSIPEVKAVIRAMNLADAQALVQRVLELPTAEDVRVAVQAYLGTLGLALKATA
jgi:phosphoenolpyruvate-protein phosphotransferase (PTS system enzyme I)